MNIDKLANGIGLLYVTEPNGTDYIYSGLLNDKSGAEAVKVHGLTKSPEGYPMSARGEVDFAAIYDDDNIGNFTINSINQLSATFNIYIGQLEAAAISLAAVINNYIPVSGPNYTAFVSGTKVIIMAPSNTGDSVNGDIVTMASEFFTSNTINIENKLIIKFMFIKNY
jgi:hypothetical protein